MSKIDDLIAKYCPNGVEYKKLCEMTFWDKKFNGSNSEIQPKIVSFKHIPAADLKNIPQTPMGTIRLLSTGNFSGTTSTELVEDKNIINNGEIISIPSGGAATIKYYKGDFIDSGNILAVSADVKVFNLKYIYHCLLNIQETLNSLFRGAGIKHPSMLEILQLKIPVPPLAVQEEIVNILDSFTLLEAELEAELVVRKQQYEHYRDELLNIADKPNVQVMALCEVADFYYGKGNTIPKNGGEYPVYGCNGIVAYTDTYNNEDGPIIGHIGSAGIVNWGKGKHFVTYNGTICSVHKDIMLSKYAYYLLKSLHLENYVKGAQPFLSASDFRDTKIPVPTLAEQERIVSILDKFDALVNDISDGLPAEINARRQQYEYYRDKLLNFEPIAA